ncbi:lasso peptide biosynthesis B2 protein [Shimazuella alba]|uniref:Lasso peptide biosynthesis B2 protein n=1 Tax=Shimazuella alba TaxID=2690964 RepID=A0A6I4VU15_9BACL|nr:lasso peptide biosynthesis B2 protein [Shimazuella alba]MXQ55279.1 lasso peptide biosynthesis B2 protein [Shimazuella alba]
MIRAWICLFVAIYLTKTYSLQQITTILQAKKSKCDATCMQVEAKEALHKIESAKRFFLSRTACLEQSLALFLFAASYSKKVDWCVGVRLAPFVSHAWIEIDGEPVNESPEVGEYKKVVIV